MNPDCEATENEICHKCSKDAKNHDVCEVLEESLSSHVVSWGEYNRRNAEVEQNIVIEDYVLLDHVVVWEPGTQTDEEADEGYVTGLVTKSYISRSFLLADDNENQEQSKEKQWAGLHDWWLSFSHAMSTNLKRV